MESTIAIDSAYPMCYEVNTDVHHVHILLSIPPKLSVGDVIKEIKAKTGLYMRRKFPFLDTVYWAKDGI